MKTLVKFQVERVDNDTFLATLVSQSNTSHFYATRSYDDEGALYYVVAVVFIYGFSIILMIGSLIKKNKADNGVSKYMKDMDKVRRMERRQQKYQTRLAMSAAGGNSRRASRAIASRTCSAPLPETGPLSAPPQPQRCTSAFPWDHTTTDWLTGGSDTDKVASTCSLLSSADEYSPRLPLFGVPPLKSSAVVASPSASPVPGRAVLVREVTTDMPHDTASPAQVTSVGRPINVSPQKQIVRSGTGDVVPAGASTVLYMENERDTKCKVVQGQLDTLHEVEEEHGEHHGKVYHV